VCCGLASSPGCSPALPAGTVYGVAAVLTAVLGLVLWRTLPELGPAQRISYGATLRSALTLARSEPVLRLRSLLGFLGFATFSMFWTSIAFLLSRPPYSFGEARIGLFALVGAAGALAARVTGRLSDHGGDHAATGGLLAALLLSWVLVGLDGGHVLIVLIAGVIVLDLAVQGAHVTNLAVIYRLAPEARSRVTTVYMTSGFLGGMVGAAVSGAAFTSAGWSGLRLAGGAFAGVALGVWTIHTALSRRPRRTPTTSHPCAESNLD
jgi:predicted MFS family arabinose efflux permease